MTLQIFGIKNCDTMKKALTWLDAQGLDFEFIDYKKTGVVAQYAKAWSQQVGWEVLLNRKGLTWKKLSEAERSHVDASKALALMAQYPTLIKRPVLSMGKHVVVGFSPETYAAFIQTAQPEKKDRT